MNNEEKIVEFITKLKRGKINILVSSDLDFNEPDEYEIAKNSAVRLKTINKRIALSKFKPFFTEKLQECNKKGSYFIKVYYEIEENRFLYLIRNYDNEFYDDITYEEDEYTTKSSELFETFEPKKIAEEMTIDEEEIAGKTHIVDSKEAIPTAIGAFLCEFSMMAIFVFPEIIHILVWVGIISGVFSIIGIITIFYHWWYVGDYYL